ncbi:hypothetical protein HYU93_05035 [Candidatus Daviesbacteria bacterium]|nr:hypothetical protein [Candidatus Daviesbacteria bacterium]
MDDYAMGEIREAIEDHVTYPATKPAIVSAFNNISTISDQDKKWADDNLRDGLYENAEEVEKAMGILK